MKVKDFSNTKSVKVDCSFCGNEMECPEEMLEKSKKHMCYECFIKNEPSDKEIKNVHVDIPMDKMQEMTASGIAGMMVEEAFPEIWGERKSELKEMSKKELAEEMFSIGVYSGIKAFMESLKQIEEEDNDKKPE